MVPSPDPSPLLLDPAFPYGEDLLQFIWERQLFDRHALRTTDGRAVEVVRPGRIQRNSGPDLTDAQVRIDGQLWAGTVEVHLRASEWEQHGHQHDPAYESVILHAVYEHDADARTRSGRILPVVELLPRVSVESIALYRSLMRERSSVPCARHLSRVDGARIGAWLDRVLVERLERKTEAVVRLVRESQYDAEEALYHLLARGFGMKVNEEPFGMLAHALPLQVLLKHRHDPFRVEALLFGQAGLLHVDFVDDYPRSLQAEHRQLAALHNLKPAPMAAWKFGRMRPANLPTLRIAQFAQLVASSGDQLSHLLGTDDPDALRQRLAAAASAYWSTHHVFDRESPPGEKRLGRAAADHLIINAVVPGLFAFAMLTGREQYRNRALALLEALPAERNAVLREWEELGVRAGSAARGQALIEQRNAYCSQRRCLLCGIGNQLLGSTVK